MTWYNFNIIQASEIIPHQNPLIFAMELSSGALYSYLITLAHHTMTKKIIIIIYPKNNIATIYATKIASKPYPTT